MAAPMVVLTRPVAIRVVDGHPNGSVPRRCRSRPKPASAARRVVAPRTAANHSGRVSHHPLEKRTGAHTPAAITAAHSANAVRCHTYTATDTLPARSNTLRQRPARRSSLLASIIRTPTWTTATTAVKSPGGVVFERCPSTASISAGS